MKDLAFVFVLFVSNIIQAITGFAGTLLAMPVSMMLIGVHEAKVILNIMAFLSCIALAVKNRKYIQWKILGKIIAYMSVGMVIGICLFDLVSLNFLLPVYGVFILLISVKKLFCPGEENLSKKMLDGSLLAAGIIHGMFVSGGALLIVYASAVLKDKNSFRATVSSVWVVLNAFLMVSDFLHGYITLDVMKLTIDSIVPLFLAVCVGNWIQKKINQQGFLKLTYGLLFLSGISILF